MRLQGSLLTFARILPIWLKGGKAKAKDSRFHAVVNASVFSARGSGKSETKRGTFRLNRVAKRSIEGIPHVRVIRSKSFRVREESEEEEEEHL